jgi:hypothetical protein
MMIHTYEVLVDIKEYDEQTSSSMHVETARYEIDAPSQNQAHDTGLHQAKNQHPKATEYDVRVTRLLH